MPGVTAVDPIAELASALQAAASELTPDKPVPPAKLERPPKPEFGDYSSNAPMLLAPVLGEPPRAVAERLGATVLERLGAAVDRVEVAGPGFLNLFMAETWFRETLAEAAAAGDAYGSSKPDLRERVLVEFVSANPTGPLTVASARGAAYGDSLARILELGGHDVEREYYVNDQGTQVRLFGESIKARAQGTEPPEDGYRGEYVAELADQIPGAAGADPDELARRAVELMLERIRATLIRFRVSMDRFFAERALHESGAVEKAIELLEEHGAVYQSEGALWLRTTTYGDDKDRVLRRSNGEYTYFASDIAYHGHKRERGIERLIDVWGADHHGYIGRMTAAWQALGGDPSQFEMLIMQLIHLMEGGQRARMSKRAGVIETLEDLIDDIGVDAARWFLLQRSHDTTIDLDLSLAREQSQDNPVYYVQYAHARIASILRNAGEERVRDALAADLVAGSGDLHPSELGLLKRLLEFPEEVRTAALRRAPHRLAAYAHDVAQQFSAFYRDCHVLGAAEEGGDEDFRLVLSTQAKRVIARSLDLLGVEAPESM
ncbi:MAG: arginine--tRNA ligase [Gaiellaceae bacterium]